MTAGTITEDRWRPLTDLADSNPTAMFSARAVADMLREATGWQPIKTAPDGGMVDIWLSEGRRWCDCYYDRVTDTWRTSRPSGKLLSVPARFVTHWMPAPPAPKEGE